MSTTASYDVTRTPGVKLCVAGLLVCCILSAVAAVFAVVPHDDYFNRYGSFIGGDYLVFYVAGRSVIEEGASAAYDTEKLVRRQHELAGRPTPAMPFVYPPVALFLWVPLACLPYLPAFYGWLAVPLGALLLTVRHISQQWKVVVVVVASPLVLRAAVTGQSGNLIAVLMGVGYLLLDRRPRLAGCCFGCLVFKPHLAILLPFCLLAGGHRGALRAAAITASSLIAIGLVAFGPTAWQGFLYNAGGFADDYLSGVDDVWHIVPTVLNTSQQLIGNGLAAWSIQLSASVIAVVVASAIWRTSSDPLARSMSLVAATFLASPKAVYYDLALFAIPGSYLAAEAFRGRISLYGILLGACLWTAPSLSQVALAIGWQPGPLLFMGALTFAFVRAEIAKPLHGLASNESRALPARSPAHD